MLPETVPCQSCTKVVFAPGSVEGLGALALELGARRVLCVTDAGVAAAGHAGKAARSLEAAGLAVAVFAGVRENPTSVDVAACVDAAREHAADFLVAVGGGSAMDGAKGANFLLAGGGDIRDYRGKDKAKGDLLPLIAIPTTAGTGSETQSFAIIADPVTHEKMACGDRRAAPRVAILDPELTVSLPRGVTAATGIDALSHAIESHVSRSANAVSRLLSLRAWELLSRSFLRVLGTPGDLAARSDMLLGASLAGAAIERSMLGAAHAAANPLTARSSSVHGHAVGLFLPWVIRFNAVAVGESYAELARAAGLPAGSPEEAAESLAGFIEGLLDRAGLPRRLGAFAVSAADRPAMAREAASQWTARHNPRPVEEGDFLGIYARVL